MLRKSVSLELEGLDIVGELYLPGEGKGLFPTVCVCHGIPAKSPDPNHRDYPLLAERICHHGFAVLIFNLRGTGASGGNLDILGWTRDLTAAVDYLCTLPEVDKSRLSLLGFSGGGAVSVYVAAQDRRVSSIATCACPAEFGFLTEVNEPQAVVNHFRSIGTIRDKDFPHSAREWFGGFRLVSPINYVARIAPRPLLLVHGSRDETVDISQAYKLYDEAWEPKQLIIIDGAEHGLRQNDKAMTAVLDWLESHAQITGSG